MLGPWRLSRRASDRPTSSPSPDAHPHSPPQHDVHESSTKQSLDRPVTAALSTPHDAILAELYGQHPSSHPLEQSSDAPTSVQKLTTVASVGSLERSEQTASPSAQGVRSGSSSPASSPEPVYDPYSGSIAGVMTPLPDRDREKEREAGSASPFDQTRDELWSQLTRIRELQSEIAGMHIQMEAIGTNEARGAKRTGGGAGRMNTGTIPAAEEWEDPVEAEDQRRTARDAEFSNLAETFKGRRIAIDGIMNKLDDLSKALTKFHALPTPVMDFTNPRSKTQDSGVPSETQNSAAPPAHAVPPEPDQSEPVSPESPTSDANPPVAVS